MLALSEEVRFAKVIDYHSSGQEMLYGYDCSTLPLASFFQMDAMRAANKAAASAEVALARAARKLPRKTRVEGVRFARFRKPLARFAKKLKRWRRGVIRDPLRRAGKVLDHYDPRRRDARGTFSADRTRRRRCRCQRQRATR